MLFNKNNAKNKIIVKSKNDDKGKPHSNEQDEISIGNFLLKYIIICGILTFAILTFIRPTTIHQESMHPTFEDGDYILLEKQAYRFNEPERGDIIVFKSEMEKENGFGKQMLIKRIVAIPGDHIEIKDRKVYLNGKLLQEKYLPKGTPTDGKVDTTIPEDCYFAMGDNREFSIDCRYDEVGLVKKEAEYFALGAPSVHS